MLVVSTQIYTELIFLSNHHHHMERVKIISKSFLTHLSNNKKTQIKHLLQLPRLVYFYITIICINEEFIPHAVAGKTHKSSTCFGNGVCKTRVDRLTGLRVDRLTGHGLTYLFVACECYLFRSQILKLFGTGTTF